MVESFLTHCCKYFSALEELVVPTYLTCLILHEYTVVDSGVDNSFMQSKQYHKMKILFQFSVILD